MTKNSEVVSVNPAAPATLTTYTETAQECIQSLGVWQQKIPRISSPPDGDATRRLAPAASVSPEFVELTNIAVSNHKPLVRAESVTPEESRDLMAYANAFDPLADQLEALALYIRYSTTFARNKAGAAALTTYSLATRLSKQPATAYLRPHVADMRRALGRDRKPTLEEAARRAAARAEKAAARAAKALAALQASAESTPKE
jgi:hypothetical protein